MGEISDLEKKLKEKFSAHSLAIGIVILLSVGFLFVSLYSFQSISNPAGNKAFQENYNWESTEPVDNSVEIAQQRASYNTVMLYMGLGIVLGIIYYVSVARTEV